MTSSFQTQFSFIERKQEASRIISKYPDRIAIICEKSRFSKNIPDIDRKKYLIPKDLTVGQFISIVRKRINLSSEMAVFLFMLKPDNKVEIPPTSDLISVLYNENKNDDGFLYFLYSSEETFGN